MKKDMTMGNPLKIILLFALPIFVGNILQQLYNVADTMIVGRYLGTKALAAVGSTGMISFLVIGFSNGLTQGFSVTISQAFGSGNAEKVKKDVAMSLLLTLIGSVLLTVPTFLSSKQFLLLMNTPADILEEANTYIRIIYAGILFTMSYNMAAGILRSIGDSRTPLYFLIFSSLLNILLDLLLIVAVPMGVSGAAYATIIAQGISAVLSFLYMFRKYPELRVTKADFAIAGDEIRELLKNGIPMAVNYSVTAIGTMVFQRGINVFGSDIVAAMTVAFKIQNLSIQTMPALGTAFATYCAQNKGAEKYDRIFLGMRIGLVLSFVTGGIAAMICSLGGRTLIPLFLNDPSDEIVTYAMRYLYTVSPFFLTLAWIFIYRNALQGLGERFIPMVSGFVELIGRSMAIVLLIGSRGFTGVCLADPIAFGTTGILMIVTYYRWERKTRKSLCTGMDSPILLQVN